MNELSHVNREGEASMVDVTGKPEVSRTATASGYIEMQAETIDLFHNNGIKKGDVLHRAKIAGISAAIFLLIFILYTSSLIELIPIASLVGVMFMVVIGTFAWNSLK